MAETTPTPANLSAIAHLEEALTHPEPMCLAMLEIHQPEPASGTDRNAAAGPGGQEPDAVMAEAERRLRDTLRDYDELTTVDSSRFVLVLRTLADASVLGGRMVSLYDIMSQRYVVDDIDQNVEVFLGAAVRVPEETSAQLVNRVDQAVVLARSASEPGPVVL
ncbi:MAG: diguanylate cyclase domain-containing protein [Acidimicrobiales bacterium]